MSKSVSGSSRSPALTVAIDEREGVLFTGEREVEVLFRFKETSKALVEGIPSIRVGGQLFE